jgi:hypothetical protein
MTTEQDIVNENNRIIQLRKQSRNLILPRRSIAYQFANMKYGNRNTVQELAIRRKERKNMGVQIKQSQNRITSLREALLSVK